MTFDKCPWLESIPSLSLSNEAKVEIKNCKNLKSIAYSSLQRLIIEECEELVQVEVAPVAMSMPNVDGLSFLHKIEICNCRKLESIGGDLSTATCLKELTIRGCRGLKSFPNLHGLSSLQKIEISLCGELKSIGGDLSTATCLKELTIDGCDGLMSFPNLHGLSSLQKIEISFCGELKSIGGNLSTATCLKELTINECCGLMSFPNLHGLSSLQKIKIFDCHKLESIGGDLSTATCLRELTIMWGNGLKSFPNLHVLSSLQKIKIWFCNGLTSFPKLSSLQKIEIRGCGELKSIEEEDLSTAACLKELSITSCNGLMSFSSLLRLPSLQTLCIDDCGELKRLPSGLPSCTALEKLDISYCRNLISIPDDLRRSWSIPNPACLARLKELTIGCFSTELEEFPDLGFIGSHLEQLTLIAWGEPRERLLDQIQHLTALRFLNISDFDVLEALPNWFGNLSSLQSLSISNCKSLRNMKAIRCLSKLEKLDIDGCPELKELKERCARGSDSEWKYISHIPNIKIDSEEIQRNGAPIEVSSAFNYI
ncbi:hypothetical protein SLA2020_051780 [Shorea laevis]